SIDRNAITLFSNAKWSGLAADVRLRLIKAIEEGDLAEIYKHSGFRFQATKRENHDDAFRHITLAIHADYLNTFVQAIWPSLTAHALQIELDQKAKERSRAGMRRHRRESPRGRKRGQRLSQFKRNWRRSLRDGVETV